MNVSTSKIENYNSSNKSVKNKIKYTTKNKTKKKKVKPIFYLLENDTLTKMESNSNSNRNIIGELHKLEGIFEKEKKEESNKGEKDRKTRKRNLKIPVEFIIMEEQSSDKNKKQRLNEKFIELMDKLSNIMTKQGEIFKARAYQKAQETIIAYPNDILEPDQLKGLPGIGTTILEKINEYVKTGTLKLIEREQNNPINILGEVYGIGPKKANELINSGITTLKQLQENKDKLLNDVQKIGLKYHADIMKRIPRSEIQTYDTIFHNAFKKIQETDSNANFEIVGSYRRGAANSGDIDVIITADKNVIYNKFIDILLKEKIIIEVLSRGSMKCLVITKLPGDYPARRVDFLFTTPKEYPFAILYFTGSKFFNTVMRERALKMGYTFNEHGMYKMDGKKKGEMLSHNFPDEKSIFDFLNMKYKIPEERIDGRSVESKLDEMNYTQPIPTNIVASPKVTESTTPVILENAKKNKTIKINKPFKKDKKSYKPTLVIQSLQEKEKETTMEEIIKSFKQIGISVLDHLNEQQLSDILLYANTTYYNQTPILSDNEYDIIKEYIEQKYPTNEVVLEIGAPVTRNKVTLPYEMPSMDKIKPDTGALSKWVEKYGGPYLLSCKLDGVSALYTTEGDAPKLYTRGNGKVGQDISHLIPFLNLPKIKNAKRETAFTLRGELLISKADFHDFLKDKFANARNLVSGIVNQTQIDDNVKYLHFVAYEVIRPELKPSEQMEYLQKLNIETVLYKKESSLSNELLSELLIKWRKQYIYEIDGVIVCNDKIYPRKSGNPEYAFAFKMVLSDQIAEAKVVDVIWSPSKDGYLKPRVRIEPIHLGGVVIEYATGFNAAFIEQNKIGVGALIEIIRSGDVIPYIKHVTVPAEEPKMPLVSYQWNDTHVDILLEDLENDPTVKEKNISGFFKGIQVEGLSSGNVHRIVQGGFDTIPKIIRMSEEDFFKVEGFKQKLAHKIHSGIRERLDKSSLSELMDHCNIFGRGISEKKIDIILAELPDILTSPETKEEKVNLVTGVKGMAKKTAENFVEKIPLFLVFLEESGLQNKLVDKKTLSLDISNPLYGKNSVLTGLRDKELMEQIRKVGANFTSSVSKNTFLVISKTKDEDTGKASEARKLDIPIFTVDEFTNKYFPK